MSGRLKMNNQLTIKCSILDIMSVSNTVNNTICILFINVFRIWIHTTKVKSIVAWPYCEFKVWFIFCLYQLLSCKHNCVIMVPDFIINIVVNNIVIDIRGRFFSANSSGICWKKNSLWYKFFIIIADIKLLSLIYMSPHVNPHWVIYTLRL